MKKPKTIRLNLPKALKGDFTSLLVGTYGADLLFAEKYIFPSLPRSTTSRVILADRSQLIGSLDEAPEIRGMNRNYLVAPVRAKKAHHPKFLLLSGPNQGRLLVGSGNLSISGLTGPGESFTSYDWTQENPLELDAFAAIRELVSKMSGSGLIDEIATQLIQHQWRAAPWIPLTPSKLSPVLHNFDTSFIDQIDSFIDGRSVIKIVAAAPFYDRRSKAIADLLERFRPHELELLLQDHKTTLNAKSLSKVIQTTKAKTKLVNVSIPKPYSNLLIHSKFILFSLDKEDLLFQGSANLSEVALGLFGESANIEVGNLLSGVRGSFDSFVSELDQKPIISIANFSPAEFDSDEIDYETFAPVLDATWQTPKLSLRIKGQINGGEVSFQVGGNALLPIYSEAHAVKVGTELTVEFSAVDASNVEAAICISVLVAGYPPQFVCPYHLSDLIRMGSSGARLDLLREVGSLDLEDKELLELLTELDRVLIVDGKSIWRLAHPNAEVELDSDPIHGIQIRYEDLNWEALESHPIMCQYLRANSGILDLSELGLVLASLVAKFCLEASGVISEGINPNVERGVDAEPEPEDEDEDEEADEDANVDLDVDTSTHYEVPTEIQINGSGRVQRAWKSFIKRFLVGISDVEYITYAGSSVIISGYVIFNHICRNLRKLEKLDSTFLLNSQIQLWEFMWGNEKSAGYLSGLPQDEKIIALQLLKEHEDVPLTLASISDACRDVWWDKAQVPPLRDAARSFLANPLWESSTEVFVNAANAATAEYVTDAETLYVDLTELVNFTRPEERDSLMASALGVSREGFEWNSQTVKRHGRTETHPVFTLTAKCEVSVPSISQAYIYWMDSDPERSYFRLKADHYVAILDLEDGIGKFYDLRSEDEVTFPVPQGDQSKWLTRLHELFPAVA